MNISSSHNSLFNSISYPKNEIFHINEIHQTLTSRFEKQVAEYPEKNAIKDKEISLTYSELNQWANQIARCVIAQRGADPEPIVILIEQGRDFIAALLGVLKAGKFYVPLDPEFPKARNRHITENSQASLIITSRKNVELARKLSLPTCNILVLDEIDNEVSTDNLNLPISPTNLANIIYTSGSTGKPKGVVQNHCNLLHNCRNYTNSMQIVPRDRMTLLHSCSVMGAVNGIFNALLNGATLYPFDVKKEGLNNLAKWLIDEKITIYYSVVTLFRHFASFLSDNLQFAKQFQDLRLIRLGGEPVFEKDLNLYKKHFYENCLLYIGLGSTETGAIKLFIADKNTQIGEQKIPLGNSVDDMTVLLLDQAGHCVEPGEVGEICVQSQYIALGYWQNPERTQAAFLPDPEGGCQRIYRTGDLGQYLPDGSLIHKGRKDFQIKVRGYRVEVAEIEASLLENAKVKETVVKDQKNNRDETILVGYIVPEDGESLSSNELHKDLLERIPDYMLPSAFVFLESLPLTPNGKVDRRALPVPHLSQQAAGADFIAPRTSLENQISEIWCEVLNLQQVGIHQNFFELGGHSLLASQVIVRLSQVLQLELSMHSLFEHPTLVDFAEFVKQVPECGKLFSVPQLVKRNQDIVPLSFAQQRLWFLQQLEPDNSAYHITRTLRLKGQLNVEALHQALATILERHESLRTKFMVTDENPVQVVAPLKEFEMLAIDLSHKSSHHAGESLKEQLSLQTNIPFDLSSDLLLRANLFQLAEHDHVLQIIVHHIAFDGWSIGVFVRELSTLYHAYVNKQSNPLPDLPIQYSDFALWQKQWLQETNLEAQIRYWKQQLGTNLPILQLPTDYPYPPMHDYRGDKQVLLLSETLSTKIKNLTKQEHSTLFMTLMAAFQLLLHRLSGQTDIIVGTPIAGRPQANTENLIGLFLNVMAFRTDLSANPSFVELLNQIRELTLNNYSHQYLPFEQIVEAINPERSLNRHPIFEVMLNVLNMPKSDWQFSDLDAKVLDSNSIESKLPLTLYVEEQDRQLLLRLVYQTALFKAERMKLLLAQFQGLLEQIVVNFNAPIDSYSLLTSYDQPLLPNPSQSLLVPDFSPVSDQVLAIGLKQPDLPAVSQEGQIWSYQNLVSCAQKIAQHLNNLGVESRDVVALSGPRSFGLVASLLGILCSGGVLLMLDSSLPLQRRQVMLRESKAQYIINFGAADPETKQLIDGCQGLEVDPKTGKILTTGIKFDETLPLPKLNSNDPAYIFFTSGTTGKPKGVLGCHKGLSHFINWQRQTFDITSEDRVAQLTGLSFDVVLRDILMPLSSGATLCLPDPDIALLPSHILPWLNRQRISVLHLVPSIAKTWLAEVPTGTTLTTLRWLFFAGEPLSNQLVQRWRETFPQCGCLVNLYGPTETTLAKCSYQVPLEPEAGMQPIGQPLPQTQILLLSPHKQLCSIGEPGEIFIRTPFRTLGYINAHQEQQHRFVPNPFTNNPEDILYRTGDLGRYRLDGSLDILGRSDDQVKIRGVRIELGEVETALAGHSAVQTAVVMAHTDSTGDKQLVAYVVPKAEVMLSAEDLRQHLKPFLPDVMLPSLFILLEMIPLTPNGKVDRQALPTPDFHQRNVATKFVAPRTATENRLSNIWGDLLKLEHVGIYDNFFELGGHSLLAAQIVSIIETIYQVNLPLRRLFENPTIEGLARVVDNLIWCQQSQVMDDGLTLSGQVVEGEL